MAASLYEVLGVSRNATTEEVRKAYRRKALETHPDRLRRDASAAEKSASEDSFRKVNNAYEVLSDPQSRAEYDQHGVWPPPTPAFQGPSANGPLGPFSDPFFRDPFSQNSFFRGPPMDPFSAFGFGSRPGPRRFTDPFVLFDSIFGNLHRAFEVDPSFDDPFGRHGFGSNHFGRSFFGGGFAPMSLPPFDFGGGGMRGSRMQTFSNGGNGGGWVSESWTSSTVNGVTHTKCVRKDVEGNEHVTYQFPDGTERRTINGIEQSASQPRLALPQSAPPAPPTSYPTTQVTAMPPPPYSEAVAQPPYRSRSSRHHGHYDNYSGDRREHRSRHGHEYMSRENQGDRGRKYENEWDRHSYRHDGHGHGGQSGSSWRPWRS